MNLVNALLMLFFLNGCASNSNVRNIPLVYDSFVKVDVKASLTLCFPNQKTKISECTIQEYLSVGSGVIVKNDLNHSYILTAGHICVHNSNITPPPTKVDISFVITNRKQNSFSASVHILHPEYHSSEGKADLCILKTKFNTKITPTKLSNKKPELSNRVYNLSAPGGFFLPPAVPIFEGLYSGEINYWHGLTTIPAIGGSSGSPVLDKNGKLVGMIFAANTRMHHLSIVMNYEVIKEFLNKNLKLNTQPPF